MATAAELEDLRVRTATAEELADVRAANVSELVRAHKRTSELESHMAEFERGFESSIRGREDAADLEARIQTLEWELSAAERTQMKVKEAAASWDVQKASWESERVLFGQEKELWAGLSETLESERELWELERKELTAEAKDQIADAANGLHNLIQRYDIPLFSRESGLGMLEWYLVSFRLDSTRGRVAQKTMTLENMRVGMWAYVQDDRRTRSEGTRGTAGKNAGLVRT